MMEVEGKGEGEGERGLYMALTNSWPFNYVIISSVASPFHAYDRWWRWAGEKKKKK